MPPDRYSPTGASDIDCFLMASLSFWSVKSISLFTDKLDFVMGTSFCIFICNSEVSISNSRIELGLSLYISLYIVFGAEI